MCVCVCSSYQTIKSWNPLTFLNHILSSISSSSTRSDMLLSWSRERKTHLLLSLALIFCFYCHHFNIISCQGKVSGNKSGEFNGIFAQAIIVLSESYFGQNLALWTYVSTCSSIPHTFTFMKQVTSLQEHCWAAERGKPYILCSSPEKMQADGSEHLLCCKGWLVEVMALLPYR